jgi:hypothetical protein
MELGLIYQAFEIHFSQAVNALGLNYSNFWVVTLEQSIYNDEPHSAIWGVMTTHKFLVALGSMYHRYGFIFEGRP